MKIVVFKGLGQQTEITLAGVRFIAWEPEEVSDEVAHACLKRKYFEEQKELPKRRGRPPKVRNDEPSGTAE